MVQPVISTKLARIPAILVGIRFAIAPLLLVDALDRQVGLGFLILYTIAVLSDIFDGVLARKLKVSTPQLRRADSWADLCLYCCIAIGGWSIYPEVITDFRVPLAGAIAAQLLLFAICLIKFGKLPSFHTYTAKIWGLGLFLSTLGLFGFGYTKTLWLAIVLCLLNSFEEIILTLLLPRWQCDVPSLLHVIRWRQAAGNAAASNSSSLSSRDTVKTGTIVNGRRPPTSPAVGAASARESRSNFT